MPPRFLSPFGLLLRPFRRRPAPPLSPGASRLRAWFLYSERSIDDCNARVCSRLASHGVDLSRFDLSLVTWEDFQRGCASALLPDSRSLPVDAVVAGLALEYALRPAPARAAAREWLDRAETFWVLAGLGLKGPD